MSTPNQVLPDCRPTRGSKATPTANKATQVDGGDRGPEVGNQVAELFMGKRGSLAEIEHRVGDSKGRGRARVRGLPHTPNRVREQDTKRVRDEAMPAGAMMRLRGRNLAPRIQLSAATSVLKIWKI